MGWVKDDPNERHQRPNEYREYIRAFLHGEDDTENSAIDKRWWEIWKSWVFGYGDYTKKTIKVSFSYTTKEGDFYERTYYGNPTKFGKTRAYINKEGKTTKGGRYYVTFFKMPLIKDIIKAKDNGDYYTADIPIPYKSDPADIIISFIAGMIYSVIFNFPKAVLFGDWINPYKYFGFRKIYFDTINDVEVIEPDGFYPKYPEIVVKQGVLVAWDQNLKGYWYL